MREESARLDRKHSAVICVSVAFVIVMIASFTIFVCSMFNIQSGCVPLSCATVESRDTCTVVIQFDIGNVTLCPPTVPCPDQKVFGCYYRAESCYSLSCYNSAWTTSMIMSGSCFLATAIIGAIFQYTHRRS